MEMRHSVIAKRELRTRQFVHVARERGITVCCVLRSELKKSAARKIAPSQGAGREAIIAGLCESPLTFQAIIIWRDELNEGRSNAG